MTGALTRQPPAPGMWNVEVQTPLTAAQRVARYGLVAAYGLSDVSDSYGTNTLTNTNAVTFVAGKVGNAGQFVRASSKYLTCADNAALSVPACDFAVGVWFWLDSKPNEGVLVAKLASSGAGEWQLEYIGGGTDRLAFTTFNASAQKGTKRADTFGAVATGAWHFGFAYNDVVSSRVGISIDGGPFDLGVTNGNPADTATAFTIGAYASGDFAFDGKLDAVHFFKPPTPVAALAAEMRDYLYASGAGREYPAGWT